MTPCEDWLAALGEAAQAEPDAALAAHLRECAPCRNELESLRRTTALLVDARPEVPELRLAGFYRQVGSQLAPREGTLRSAWFALQGRQRAAVAALAVLLAASGVVGGSALSRPAGAKRLPAWAAAGWHDTSGATDWPHDDDALSGAASLAQASGAQEEAEELESFEWLGSSSAYSSPEDAFESLTDEELDEVVRALGDTRT